MAELAHDAGTVGPAASERPRWRWSAADTVVALAAGLTAIIFAIFGFLCWQGYGATIDGARSKALVATEIVDGQTHWLIGAARALLSQASAGAQSPADVTPAELGAMRTAIESLPAAATLGFYDATGNAFGGSASPDLPADIADQDFFKSLEAGTAWTVSPQLPDTQHAGRSVFVVAQRLGGSQFGGVVLLAFDVAVLKEFWAPQRLGPESTTSLVRADGMLVARYPSLPATVDLSTSPPFKDYPKLDSGTYESANSPVDGVARVVAFRRLGDLGLVVFASVSRDAILAGLWNAIITVLWLMVPIGLALIVGSLLTARILRRSARTQASLAAAVAHNEVLFREIHHRVKNNLQSVGSLLQMQPIPREIKRDMGQRIAAMSAVHEHIYRSNDFAKVRVKDYLQTLVESIRAGADPNVQVVEQLEDLAVDKDVATPLGLILNEVVANAFKHAFPDGRAGVITVRLERQMGHGALVVEDNGVGFDPALPAKGIGRRLITALTQQLGGESGFGSDDKGSRFTLTFPLAE